uniref:Uncharacterized protein n=1 Tax=Schistocephalus solidus TaxID=70667 RepID=A0A0X3NIW5_SCHSO
MPSTTKMSHPISIITCNSGTTISPLKERRLVSPTRRKISPRLSHLTHHRPISGLLGATHKTRVSSARAIRTGKRCRQPTPAEKTSVDRISGDRRVSSTHPPKILHISTNDWSVRCLAGDQKAR